METQLDFDYGDQPNLPRELVVKSFDDEYEKEYHKASVDVQTMTSFFSNTVRKLIEKYKGVK